MENVRYFKLHNNGAFVARMKVEYREKRVDDKGNVSYPGEWHTWEPSGYHDICAAEERSIDLRNDAHISDGAQVRLYVTVVLGKDRVSSEQYIYSDRSPSMESIRLRGQRC